MRRCTLDCGTPYYGNKRRLAPTSSVEAIAKLWLALG